MAVIRLSERSAAREIRNADVFALKEYEDAKLMLEWNRRQREYARDTMTNISARMENIPHPKGEVNGLDAALARLAELDDAFGRDVAEYVQKTLRVRNIILKIPYDEMRSFAIARYVEKKSRAEVMACLKITEWQYREISKMLEEAPSMDAVKWQRRYIMGSDSDGAGQEHISL